MIEVEQLVKRYGDLVAVDGVSFEARPGRVYGLLGPNGAGKSTTIGCLSGLLRPDSGSVRLCGVDLSAGAAARRELGLVPQELALYEELSAPENLKFYGRAVGLRGAGLTARVDAVLERVGLADRAKEAVSKFSGGMKRRLNFACGVVHSPKVLLLDEPTVGVDPQSRVALLDLVREEASRGAAVLYTTHYMEEAESLCDDLGIVDHGKLVAQGTLESLRERMGGRDLVQLEGEFEPERVRAAIGALGDVDVLRAESESLTLSLPHAGSRLPSLFEALTSVESEIGSTTLKRPSLESLFIQLTGRDLRE